jgi:hypothetical protein
LRRELHRRRHSGLAIMDVRQNDASRTSYGQHFVHNLFHELFCIVALRDFAVMDVAQRGYSVQRAITKELQP